MADESWRDALPEEVRTLETLQDIPDVQTLAKSYDDAQRYIGRSIRIPTDDAGDGQWDQFKDKLKGVPGMAMLPGSDDSAGWNALYDKLGRPESPSGYGIDDATYAQVAHENGLTDKQAKALHESLNKAESETNEQRQAQLMDMMSDLQNEWGGAFEKKGREAHQAADYMDKRIKADGKFSELVNQPGIGDHPLIIKMLAEIGSMLGEKTIAATDGANVFGIVPSEAAERAAAIIGDMTDAYHDQAHPNHMNRVQHVAKLMQIAHPEQ